MGILDKIVAWINAEPIRDARLEQPRDAGPALNVWYREPRWEGPAHPTAEQKRHLATYARWDRHLEWKMGMRKMREASFENHEWPKLEAAIKSIVGDVALRMSYSSWETEIGWDFRVTVWGPGFSLGDIRGGWLRAELLSTLWRQHLLATNYGGEQGFARFYLWEGELRYEKPRLPRP